MAKILTDEIIPELKGKTEITDSGWVNLPFSEGQAVDGHPLKCRTIKFPSGGGIVFVRGAVTNLTSQYPYLGTLPPGSRPSFTQPFLGSTGSNTFNTDPVWRFTINTVGGIEWAQNVIPKSTNTYWLDASFPIE